LLPGSGSFSGGRMPEKVPDPLHVTLPSSLCHDYVTICCDLDVESSVWLALPGN
jgi:hypothetical protein